MLNGDPILLAGATAGKGGSYGHPIATLLLLARGVHPKIVSKRLGHAGVGISLDTYSHVLPNLQEEADRDLDAWLSGRG